MAKRAAAPPLPTVSDIRAWLQASGERPKASRAAKAFGVRGVEDRRAFKELFRQALGGTADVREQADGMPPVTLLEVTGADEDGAPVATPAQWTGNDAPPPVRVEAGRGAGRIAKGVRMVARIEAVGDEWVARPIRILPNASEREAELAVVEEDGRGDLVLRAARPGRARYWKIAGPRPDGLEIGDLALAAPEAARAGPRGREYRARILSTHGRADDPAAFGLALMASLDAPIAFAPETLAAAESAGPPDIDGRDDLRTLPLVTIDGADARDFDDAVFAEPDGSGWRVIVAIADVAHYVRPGSPLDREARLRGNSTYLPDRAIPMLPEALSNGLCSLKPEEDRACLYVEMAFDAAGKRRSARFGRGLMRSHARLTYEIAAAVSEAPDAAETADQAKWIENLYGAYAALKRARKARGPLELELPERTVAFDAEGRATALGLRPALTSHGLIEEFMVQANAAAAELLEAKGAGALFRIHDKPDPEKMGLMSETAQRLGVSAPGARIDTAARLTALLTRVEAGPIRSILSELILRAQAQARYTADCTPHFGLALDAYAHFTSPIRRYADLVVHRALVRALDLGDGGENLDDDALDRIADAVNRTERRSASIERAVLDRYSALLATAHVGETHEGRIIGANRAGLFIRFDDPLLEGFAPAEFLPDDYWRLSRDGLAMEGRRSGKSFSLGDRVVANIVSADATTGGVTLEIKTTLKSAAHKKRDGKRFTRKRRK